MPEKAKGSPLFFRAQFTLDRRKQVGNTFRITIPPYAVLRATFFMPPTSATPDPPCFPSSPSFRSSGVFHKIQLRTGHGHFVLHMPPSPHRMPHGSAAVQEMHPSWTRMYPDQTLTMGERCYISDQESRKGGRK